MKRKISRTIISMYLIGLLIAALIISPLYIAPLIFWWVIISFMFVNFWLYERKESGTYFIFPIILMGALTIQSIIALIGWIVSRPVFTGMWGEIFGWQSFFAAILLTAYMICMLDKGMRQDFIHFFTLKKYRHEEVN